MSFKQESLHTLFIRNAQGEDPIFVYSNGELSTSQNKIGLG